MSDFDKSEFPILFADHRNAEGLADAISRIDRDALCKAAAFVIVMALCAAAQPTAAPAQSEAEQASAEARAGGGGRSVTTGGRP